MTPLRLEKPNPMEKPVKSDVPGRVGRFNGLTLRCGSLYADVITEKEAEWPWSTAGTAFSIVN